MYICSAIHPTTKVVGFLAHFCKTKKIYKILNEYPVKEFTIYKVNFVKDNQFGTTNKTQYFFLDKKNKIYGSYNDTYGLLFENEKNFYKNKKPHYFDLV